MMPVIFSIGPLHFYSFGLMVAAGVLISLLLMERRAKLDGFPKAQDASDLVFATLALGFIGSRLAYVFQEWRWYLDHPLKLFAVWEGGLIFYGGAVTVFVGLPVFMRLRHISVLKGFDFMIPYGVLTHAFGRLGCFLNGCCAGKPCDLPWAVRFPGHPETVHPTQLYEAVFNGLLFLFLIRRYSGKHYDGQILCAYFVLYSAGRFAIEFFRAENPAWLWFSWNQWLSVILVAGFGLYGAVLKRGAKSHDPV